jgi:integrase
MAGGSEPLRLIRNIFIYFTQETGHPVPVSPHSLRHMLSKYLDEIKIDNGEHESFSYVLHHSPETNKEKYVYREKMMRIAPAVSRMQSILESCMIK